MSFMRHQAVRNIHSDIRTVIEGDPWQYLDADGNDVSIDEDAVQEEEDRLQSEDDALQYQRDRKPEYPSMADQLDYIYHNGIAKWKSDIIKPVKDAHPKP